VAGQAGLYVGENTVNVYDGEELLTLGTALAWIGASGQDNVEYTIVLGADEMDATTNGYIIGTHDNANGNNSHTKNKKHLTITLKGTTKDITITKSAAGPLFTVNGNSSSDEPHLIVKNITLRGYASNNKALISVGYSTTRKGTFTLGDDGTITGNINTGSVGGGVYVLQGSTFYMAGGTITSNKVTGTAAKGGGVYNSGTFIMTGGTITNNTAGNENTTGEVFGGGVRDMGTFTMSGGTISGNKCIGNSAAKSTYIEGGGVYAFNFTMSGTALIAGNEATEGGGVSLYYQAVSNTTPSFVMNGGTIKGNRAQGGAAVYRYAEATFSKNGGTIFGNSMELGEDANKGTSETVHAIEIRNANSLLYYRDTTAGTDVNLSSGAATNWGQ
jgi:hypothetical protein